MPACVTMSRCVTLPKSCIVRAVLRFLTLISTFAGLGFASSQARAADERALASLNWNRTAIAAECLDASALVAGVEARLQRKVFVLESQADIKIRVVLDASRPGNWTASIDLTDRSGSSLGHRELTMQSDNCSALDDSLALMVSLMVDVTRESVQPKPELASPAQVSPPPSPLPAATPLHLDAPSPVVSSPWRYGLYVLGNLRDGQLPGLGRGVTLQGELSSKHGFAALLSAAVWAPSQRSEDGLGAKFSLATVEANACGTLSSKPNSDLFLCLGYQSGLVRSSAFGFDVNQNKTLFIQDLTLRLRATFWVTASFGLHGALGVALPLIQDEFFGTRADGSRVRLLSRPGMVPLAELGLAIRFGT